MCVCLCWFEGERRGGGGGGGGRSGVKKKLTFFQKKNGEKKNTFSVVFYARSDAEDAVKYLSGAVLDERPIRVDFDWGFVEGRQYGRCVFRFFLFFRFFHFFSQRFFFQRSLAHRLLPPPSLFLLFSSPPPNPYPTQQRPVRGTGQGRVQARPRPREGRVGRDGARCTRAAAAAAGGGWRGRRKLRQRGDVTCGSVFFSCLKCKALERGGEFTGD